MTLGRARYCALAAWACVLCGLAGVPRGEAADGRKPHRFGDMPGGASYAYVPDERADVPKILCPDGTALTAVRVEPLVPRVWPEELVDEAAFDAPDPVPACIAWDGRSLWVSGRKTSRLYALDPNSGKVRRSLPAPGGFPTGLAWDGSRMWHTDARARKLYCLEADKVVREFPLDWHCTGVAAAGEELVIGDWDSDKLRFLSPKTGKVTRTVDAPEAQVFGVDFDGTHLWCARRDCLIVHDVRRGLPVATFGVARRHPDAAVISGVALAGDSLWYADIRKGRLFRIRRPRHGQAIAAKGIEREATFHMDVFNDGPDDWAPFEFLWHVAVYEMPGQRYLGYEIDPAPVAHYRSPEGNLYALFRQDRLPAGEKVSLHVRVRLWSADRWVFLDPTQCTGPIPAEYRRICRKEFAPELRQDDPLVRGFAAKAAAGEDNPYWKLRRVHDAFVDHVTYAQPPDESVPGVLRTGKGVCRNFSACMQALGRGLGVPVLDAWAPQHNLVCGYLPGAGWAFVEITANNSGETTSRLRRGVWFGGLPRGQLTTGVAGPHTCVTMTVDGRAFLHRRHCHVPKGYKGFREKDQWTQRNATSQLVKGAGAATSAPAPVAPSTEP